MHKQRLEHAATVFGTLKQRGGGDVLNTTVGDQLVGWGAPIPAEFEAVRAYDLRVWLAHDADFQYDGLRDLWPSPTPGLTIGITHLARFFGTNEHCAFFLLVPLQTPIIDHASARL